MDMETPPLPPPLIPPPPPVITPPPPAKPRRSRGWMIFAIILLVLLAISLFGNLTQFVSRALSSGLSSGLRGGFRPTTARDVGPRLDECVLEDNDSRKKIAVITVDGIISDHTVDQAGNSMVDVIKAQLDRAKDDDRVKAGILKVDSPGGEGMASDEINKVLADFQRAAPAEAGRPAKAGKPVICSMGSLAASGGYYISVPCRWIVANELTITGSIGVIMHGYNYRELMDKVGVHPQVFKSGRFKDMLSGEREDKDLSPEEQKTRDQEDRMVQSLID